MRQILINAYLDYVNNYLTVEKYAADNGLTYKQARDFLTLAREVFTSTHPEA